MSSQAFLNAREEDYMRKTSFLAHSRRLTRRVWRFCIRRRSCEDSFLSRKIASVQSRPRQEVWLSGLGGAGRRLIRFLARSRRRPLSAEPVPAPAPVPLPPFPAEALFGALSPAAGRQSSTGRSGGISFKCTSSCGKAISMPRSANTLFMENLISEAVLAPKS